MPSYNEREVTIRLMIATTFIMLLLAVGALASLGGDETQAAIGKVIMAAPIFALIFFLFYMAWKAKLLYLWYDLTSIIDRTSSARWHGGGAMASNDFSSMQRDLTEAYREVERYQQEAKQLEAAWIDIFGTADRVVVREAVSTLQQELETLRSEARQIEASQSSDKAAQEALQKERSTVKALQEELTKRKEEQRQIRALLALSDDSELVEGIVSLLEQKGESNAAQTQWQAQSQQLEAKCLELSQEVKSWQEKSAEEAKEREEWQARCQSAEAMLKEEQIKEASWNDMWHTLALTIRQAAALNSISMNELARLARSSQASVGKQPLSDGSFKLFTAIVREGIGSPKVQALIGD